MDAYSWDTYQAIEDKGLLDDVTSMPWDAGGEYSLPPTTIQIAHLHDSA